MSEIFDCLKTSSQITSLQKTYTNDLVFSTESDGVKIYSSQSCIIKHNFSNQFLNANVTAITFDKKGIILAYATQKAIYIANILDKEIIKIIPIDYKIQIMIFDESSKYIITGNNNGRVVQYSYLDSTPMSRLCSFPYNEKEEKHKQEKNYISALASRKNKIAVSGLGEKVVVIDIFSRTNNAVFLNSKSPICSLHFINDDLLVSANDEGMVTIYSIQERKILKEIQTPFTYINQIISIDAPNFILISSNTNFLSVIDLNTYLIVHHKLVEFNDTIVKIAKIDEKHIAVALKNKEVKMFVLTDYSDLRSLILHNSLDKAYELVENEPILKYTQAFVELEDVYNIIYKKAVLALNNQNESLAKELLKMFSSTKSKREQINSLFRSFRYYEDLKSLYKNDKIALSYALVSKYPELEHTPFFRKLEELWRIDFKNAQIDMLKGRFSKAKTTLDKYKTVIAKREMIDLVLKQNKEFVNFLIALDKHNYTKAIQIAKLNNILTKIPAYEKLQSEIEYKIDQIKTFIYQGDTQKAKTAMSIIQDITHIKDKMELFLKECEWLEILQSHYENNNFKKCYETIDNYPFLYKTHLGKLLERHWETLIEKCEYFALKGNIIGVKKTLGDLITLNTRVGKTGDLFRLCFHIKIKESLSKRSFRDVETLIYRYSDIFGIDHEIKELMKRYELKTNNKLALTHNSTTNRNSWIDSDFVK